MLSLRVQAIERNTADTSTFYLLPVDGSTVSYQAGQFLTLVIEHHGQEVRRSYSLSSSPHEQMLSLTIKRIPNGEVTRYLHTYARVGDIWKAVEPAGRFTLPEPLFDAPLVYFAAGSGISPIYAHLKSLIHQGFDRPVYLFYSNLSASSIIFKKELDELSAASGGHLKIMHLISDEGKRLNNYVAENLIRQYLPDTFRQAQYYLCGPFTYMRMVRLTLLYMHVDDTHIHRENFVLETVPSSTTVTNFEPHKIRISFKGEVHDLVTGANQTILQAALQNDLHLPYSCGAGVCAACAVKCTSGQVTVVKNEVLTDAEMKQGWILTCTGYAASDDVRIEYR